MNIPVLFIVCCRIELTKKVFAQIRCAKPARLYVACDGPRKVPETEKVESVRQYVLTNIDWECEVKTLFNEINLGVAFAPAKAISWFFEFEEMGIILEDDCLPGADFFRFCDEMLNHYRDAHHIAMIQGFNPFPKTRDEASFWFSKYNLCWGWATWRDRWQHYDLYTRDWPRLKRSGFLDEFSEGDRLVRSYWESLFNIVHRRPSVGWDAQLSLFLFSNKYLTIVPGKNLIINIGYESDDASSTKYAMPNYMRSLKLAVLHYPLRYPAEMTTFIEYDKLVEIKHFKINMITVTKLAVKNFMERNKILSKLVPTLANGNRWLQKICFRLSSKYKGVL
jgi:hypothetical protein